MGFPKEPFLGWFIIDDPFREKYFIKDNYLIHRCFNYGWDLSKIDEKERKNIEEYYKFQLDPIENI